MGDVDVRAGLARARCVPAAHSLLFAPAWPPCGRGRRASSGPAVRRVPLVQVLEPWGDQKRVNRLIFIGKNLNREELKASFESCLSA